MADDTKQFDIEGARKAGYSDDEIAQHLSQSKGFDLAGAQKAGYSSQEILEHLTEGASAPATPAPEEKPNSIIGGFGRRAIDTAKGLYETFKPASETDRGEQAAAGLTGPGGLALYRMGKGAVEGYKQKFADLAQDLSTGQYGKAALHGAQLIEPGIGPANPTSSLLDTAAEGRYREALGGAAFDALTTLLGSKLSKGPSVRARVGKLTAAVGKTGETGQILTKVLPDLENSVNTVGAKPETLGDLQHATQTALDTHEAKFNQALAGVQNRLVDPSSVRQSILNLVKSDSSPEEIAAIHKAANEYLQPKTMQWLNDRRMRLNSYTASAHGKSSGASATQMRSDLDMAIDRTARNAVADLQYNVMDRTYPGQNFGQLKGQQSALWTLKDQLTDRIGDLTDQQLEHEGKGIWDRLKPSAYASKSGIHGYFSGITDMFSPGPIVEADQYVKKGMRTGPSPARAAAAGAVLSSPLSRLTLQKASPEQSQEMLDTLKQRRGGMTIPPATPSQ